MLENRFRNLLISLMITRDQINQLRKFENFPDGKDQVRTHVIEQQNYHGNFHSPYALELE